MFGIQTATSKTRLHMCYNNTDMCSLIIDVGNYTPPRFIAFPTKISGTTSNNCKKFKTKLESFQILSLTLQLYNVQQYFESQHNKIHPVEQSKLREITPESFNSQRMSSHIEGNIHCYIFLWKRFNLPGLASLLSRNGNLLSCNSPMDSFLSKN